MINGVVMRTKEGKTHGGNLSSLLSNIMLHELDIEFTRSGLRGSEMPILQYLCQKQESSK